ncbi:hypothetical protein MXD81_30655 [Microbacteriaceae bacterium K1510]|nr:hypothetical protein [Microbacteriaceae bacterium K1510]
MKVIEILQRGQACCAGLPERNVSAKTLEAYKATFARMWREPELNALRPDIALDTFHHRRAALHAVSRLMVTRLIANCFAAGDRTDIAAVQRGARMLKRVLDRIEPALALDPPLVAGASPLQSPHSRWRKAAGPHPQRGRNSKKHVLRHLPEDWQERLWQAAPEDWPYRPALAVHLLTPARPEEVVAGERAHGWSPGIEVELRSRTCLALTISPAKTHNGRFGTPSTTITVDPTEAGGPAAYLAELCTAAGGRTVVSLRSKNAMRKGLARLGRRALPEVGVVITAYVLRHQAVADLKATVGAGTEVAVAAGHCTDRTQARYGRAEHGKTRKGFMSANSARSPRVGNVERGYALSKTRRLKSSVDTPSK